MASSWVCVDASLVLRTIVGPGCDRCLRLWRTWDEERREVVAPTLLFYEVTNGVYRYLRANLLSVETVRMALATAQELPISLAGKLDLHSRALSLAAELSLDATYDAQYLALAEHLGAELWTADARLARKLEGKRDYVRLTEG